MILFLLPVGSALIASGCSASLKTVKKKTCINKHKQKVNSHVVRSKTSGLGDMDASSVISFVTAMRNTTYVT